MNASQISLINHVDPPSQEFEALLVTAIPGVRRLSFALAGPGADADDLLQATLERALAKWRMYEMGTRIEAWLYRVCRNIWIDEMRSVRNRKELTGLLENTVPEQSYEGDVTTDLNFSEVEIAISKLSDTQRAALCLVGIEGFSYKEAASILELPIGTVMSRLARARNELAQALNFC